MAAPRDPIDLGAPWARWTPRVSWVSHGVTKRLWEMSDIVNVLEAWESSNA